MHISIQILARLDSALAGRRSRARARRPRSGCERRRTRRRREPPEREKSAHSSHSSRSRRYVRPRAVHLLQVLHVRPYTIFDFRYRNTVAKRKKVKVCHLVTFFFCPTPSVRPASTLARIEAARAGGTARPVARCSGTFPGLATAVATPTPPAGAELHACYAQAPCRP